MSDFSLEHAEYQLAGRLKPGITRIEAQAECLTIWRSVMKDYYEKIEKRLPETISPLLKRGVEVQSLERGTSILRGKFRRCSQAVDGIGESSAVDCCP